MANLGHTRTIFVSRSDVKRADELMKKLPPE